jgi:hypothetical protein
MWKFSKVAEIIQNRCSAVFFLRLRHISVAYGDFFEAQQGDQMRLWRISPTMEPNQFFVKKKNLNFTVEKVAEKFGQIL